MISDLSLDLLEEILSRIPATSLKILRSTCKRWNTLFKDQSFTAKHFRNAAKESTVLMLKDYRVFPMNVNLNATPPSIDFEGALSTKIHYRLSKKKISHYSRDDNICTVFHCDGVLLCTTSDKGLLLWNPCMRQTMWIELEPYISCNDSWFGLGYEQNQYGHSYKIFMKSYDDLDRFKIYDFITHEWRVLDDVNHEDCRLSSSGVSLKGNIYWIAEDNKDDGSQFLLSFDFTLEKYRRFGLPDDDDGDKMVLTLSVVGEKQLLLLSASYDYESSISKMDIWVTNEIDSDIETPLKWSKSFTFDIPNFRYTPVLVNYLIAEKKVVMYCLEKVLIHVCVFGEKDESYREICAEPTYQRSWWYSSTIFNYAPSLVQVPSGMRD